ncbi:group II intron reverse transcriptase/maturase [Sphingomonas sp. CCH5-A5]|uniref:group II intron reverse transcriptase/maturase n=1 Tax=Sphingomonas sp. CCH5-A5 TaxID=1768741 RepID=UPI0009E92D97|nr:group II intron reverse transcriptase/maturase [Sphingomonas sp. CCH5-A5]
MRTSAAALELDFTEPSITAAKAVADTLARNGSLQRDTLLWVMEQAYGGSSADGRWSLRDAYDMLELAQVMHLAKADLPSAPNDCLAALTELVANLPTHTVRSEEQIELQQFSTPAPIAYLATLAARIAPTDLVLEPSAGTGLLAVFARRAGARMVLNEIDPARAEMLAAAFPGVAVTRHDAELIHDFLPPTIRPTAVLINPPFSRSIGRHADPLAAFRHLRAALMRLGAGGRCAAILPDRIDTSSRAWAKATAGCALTLHLELPANAYAKHGTSQTVKIMVLEKGTGDHAELLRCGSLAEALAAIVACAGSPAPVARVSTPQLARPSGRGPLLGGLASKQRLATPIRKASDGAAFLGYEVRTYTGRQWTVRSQRGSQHFSRRPPSEVMQLSVPWEKVFGFAARKGYGDMAVFKAKHRNILLSCSDVEIVLAYNAELRGFANYYALARDVKQKLNRLEFIQRWSMFKTMASKHKSSVRAVAARMRSGQEYRVDYLVDGQPRSVKVWKLMYLDRGWVDKAKVDIPPRTQIYSHSRTDWVDRQNAKQCSACGRTDRPCQVHHVEGLADIAQRGFAAEMKAARSRRTRVLCDLCHVDLHRGRLSDTRNMNGIIAAESRMQ